MKALKIDPHAKTITEVEFDGTPAGLAALFPYKEMRQEQINNFGDYVMFNGGGLLDGVAITDGVWGVYYPNCGDIHAFGGIAYIYGNVNIEEQVLNPPYITLAQAIDIVEWGTIRKREDKGEVNTTIELLKMLLGLGTLSALLKGNKDKGEDTTTTH